nr:hypothetical protein CFP56_02643 [Quercus suber]
MDGWVVGQWVGGQRDQGVIINPARCLDKGHPKAVGGSADKQAGRHALTRATGGGSGTGRVAARISRDGRAGKSDDRSTVELRLAVGRRDSRRASTLPSLSSPGCLRRVYWRVTCWDATQDRLRTYSTTARCSIQQLSSAARNSTVWYLHRVPVHCRSASTIMYASSCDLPGNTWKSRRQERARAKPTAPVRNPDLQTPCVNA